MFCVAVMILRKEDLETVVHCYDSFVCSVACSVMYNYLLRGWFVSKLMPSSKQCQSPVYWFRNMTGFLFRHCNNFITTSQFKFTFNCTCD
jgi:hypothetical protein